MKKETVGLMILIAAIGVGSFSMSNGDGFWFGFGWGLVGAWLCSRLFWSFKADIPTPPAD